MIGLLNMLGLARGGVAVLGFVLLLLVSAALGLLLSKRARRPARAAWILSGLGTVAALALTLWPDTGSSSFGCTVEFSWRDPFEVQNLANIALLFPATCFATVACRRPATVLAAGSGLSAAIELTQALLPPLHRACDTGDWQMNSIGAAIGAVIGWWITRLAARPAAPGGVGSGHRHRRSVTRVWTGAAAAAVVVWFTACALDPIPPYPCDEQAAGASTTIPGGVQVRAGRQTGRLCFIESRGDTAASDEDSAPGPIDSFGTGTEQWSIGVAPRGALTARDSRGNEALTYAVEGSALRVWSTYGSGSSAAAKNEERRPARSGNRRQVPSETTSTVPSTTRIAVWSSMA